MTQITEDYVSVETAKLLKEKGFTLPVKNYYSLCIEDAKHNLQKKYGAKKNWNSFALAVSRPSQSLVMKWLREVHHIPIEILWHYDSNSDIEEWYFIHHAELRILPNNINYFDTYEEACEAGIRYCLENLI